MIKSILSACHTRQAQDEVDTLATLASKIFKMECTYTVHDSVVVAASMLEGVSQGKLIIKRDPSRIGVPEDYALLSFKAVSLRTLEKLVSLIDDLMPPSIVKEITNQLDGHLTSESKITYRRVS